ncbi:hypothetical protein DASC09_035060 [Saccharomycopsis crataegensis]|uniref:Globin domain-containing protein n=1 Tax=Saccharomycopsis crataegensis TaxID=43959 RepID=A0AAV5QNN4_9ASCO|nr:hypothetical protein DASC09_035060 [Saccharomycopsis crataegensis]
MRPLSVTSTNNSTTASSASVFTSLDSELTSVSTQITHLSRSTTPIKSNFDNKQPQPQQSMHHQLRKPLTLSLSPREIKLLKSSWSSMLNDIFDESSDSSEEDFNQFTSSSTFSKHGSPGAAASMFCQQLYMNLLNLDPHLTTMFPTIQHQASALSGVITIALSSLPNIHVFDDYLAQIGRRHSRVLNIETAHFELMLQALLITFEDRLSERFTLELEDTWVKLYGYLANKILESYAEDFILDPIADEPIRAIIDPLTNQLITPNTNSKINTSVNSSDSESLYSTDSLSVKHKPSLHSLNTVLTNVSSNNTPVIKKTNSNQRSGSSSHADSEELISNAQGNGHGFNSKLSKFYNFYKPKAIR